MKSTNPNRRKIAATLGDALEIWDTLVAALEAEYGPLTAEWKASKSDFGSMCAWKQKKRTVVYLTPETEAVCVAIVLGERAAQAALDSDLPATIKSLIAAARPYAEGRGIRLSVKSLDELPAILQLAALKMSP
jgi:hypothetical protein